MQILFDPNPADGGGTEVKPETKVETKPVAITPTADPAMLSELMAAKTRLREFETKDAERKEAERKAADEQKRQSGEWEKLTKDLDAELANQRKATDEAVRRSQTHTRDKELAVAIAGGPPLRDGALEDLMKLWRDDFAAEPSGDTWKVIAKDGRSVADVVNERLKSDRYANFVKAEGRVGGGGQQGGASSAQTQQKQGAPAEGSYDFVMSKAAESAIPINGHPLANGRARFGLKYSK